MITFVASIVGAVIADIWQGKNRVTEYYDKARDFEPYQGWVPMEGRGVTWWVEPGEAIWIEAKYLRPISGNIFYGDKLGAVAYAIKQGDVQLYAPFGQITLITPAWVAESIQYAEDDVGVPWTTGDDELDEWLVRPDKYMDDRGYDDEERAEMQAELEAELAEAVRTGQGDLGHWMATVRDGNHRAFGAVLGGEEAVAIRIYDNDVQDIKEDLRKGEWTLDNKPLLAKMIEDTGQEPYWLERIIKSKRLRE